VGLPTTPCGDTRPPRRGGGQAEGLVASTHWSVRVLETSHPPAFYLPPESVIPGRLMRAPGSSHCEWKGAAEYVAVAGTTEPIGWGDTRIRTRNSPTAPSGSCSTQAGSAARWTRKLCDFKPVVSTGDGSPTTLSARSRVSPARLGGERPMTSETGREGTDPTTPIPETTPIRPNDDQAPRRRLADFDCDEANQRWLVVNDDVMGGRSHGGLSFDGGILTFEGEIDTGGVGFSSLRLLLEPQTLSPYDRIELRARPDDRAYMVTFGDDLASGDRRVSHRAPIEFPASGEWQIISVSFDKLSAAIFGWFTVCHGSRSSYAAPSGAAWSAAVYD